MSNTSEPQSSSILSKAITTPIILSFSLLSRAFSVLRPYAPTIVPLFVCALFIPLVLLLSTFSGWFVWSNLSVSWKVPIYLQYGDGIAPYAYVEIPHLIPGQRYDIGLDLALPFMESNIALGNFMTTLTLSTTNNKTLNYVRRPAIALPPRSLLPFFTSTIARMNVPLIESFIASKSDVFAAVEIGRRDGWTTLGTGQGREVSVVSASLTGLAVPHGIRGFAIRFPFLASVASAGIFLLFLSSILGTCVLPLILPAIPSEDNGESNYKQEQIPSSVAPYPAQERERRRRRSKSDRSSTERQVKGEASVEIIPPTTEDSSTRLRRRPSRPPVSLSEDAANQR
ncbi:hypothetical protein BDN70DRAFT_883523 [Pholiota conissans]|uniref:Seipin n=1 Tax=Pholiota conissans TaxID=109636 RepID=A0A9P5YVV8_9AGAR|nr:hypothetical protein BDN70DRAFT_883523 [Pholiota conissans]